MVTQGLVRLIHHQALDVFRGNRRPTQVVHQNLRREKEHALLLPAATSLGRLHRASHLCSVVLRNAHHVEAGFDLLSHQRLRRRHEDNLAEWIPTVEVEHHHSGNKRLSKA